MQACDALHRASFMHAHTPELTAMSLLGTLPTGMTQRSTGMDEALVLVITDALEHDDWLLASARATLGCGIGVPP